VELEKDLPAHTRNNLEKIFSSGSNLLKIVNDILDISKIEAGGFEIIPIDYVYPNMVNDVVELNIVRLESKDLVFEMDIDETIPIKLNGDELRVKQVLNNLLSNAFKYTEEGSVKFQASWSRQGDNALLKFSVTDTGIGIKREDIPKLFKEYSQLNQRPNRNIEGTGLGLSITKHLVDMMHGSFTVDSEYGSGSCFRVEIPQRIVSNVPIGPSVAESLRNFKFEGNRRKRGENLVRAHMPYGRVLIVDDVVINLEVAKGLMLPYGLTIDCVVSGIEAVERITAAGKSDCGTRYSLVFMDHMMPEMDGVEATRIIREEIGTDYARSVPIVALTANALSGNEDMFLSRGFNAYLSKPIDIMKLDMILNKWVRDVQSEETLRTAERRKVDKLMIEGYASAPRLLREGGVAGVDIEAGLQRYGDEVTYLNILRSYVTHTKILLEKLDVSSKGRLSDYAVTIHGIKGASKGIFAKEAGRLAEELEAAANSGDSDTIAAKNGSFMEITRTLVADLENYLSKISGKPAEAMPKERRPSPDPKILAKIRDAAKHFKTSLMEDFMAEIEQYEYDSGKELVDWLKQSVDELEYDAIVKRLEDMSDLCGAAAP
jgi:CheY-like chemotaxis protein/anti-sigma regulatory factor (Ser/Thr protein kinase)